jgi:transposase
VRNNGSGSRKSDYADDAMHEKWWKLSSVHGINARAIAARFGFNEKTVSDYLSQRRKSLIPSR